MDRRCLYNMRQSLSSLDEYLLLQKYLPLKAIFINERTDFLQGPQEDSKGLGRKMPKALTMLAVGDLMPAGPEPYSVFVPASSVPVAADILVGQGEGPLNYMSGSGR